MHWNDESHKVGQRYCTVGANDGTSKTKYEVLKINQASCQHVRPKKSKSKFNESGPSVSNFFFLKIVSTFKIMIINAIIVPYFPA